MQQSNAPIKISTPFANSGTKNTIPVASQISNIPGAASYTDGFPPLTRTPLSAGGVPPSGQDMNGILFDVSAAARWLMSGGSFAFDATHAAAIGGYPKGARVLRADGLGHWRSISENNSTDPDAAGAAGWVPDSTAASTTITLASADVALTPAQAAFRHIFVNGVNTSSGVTLTFPLNTSGQFVDWVLNNSTQYPLFVKSPTGTAVRIAPYTIAAIYGNANEVGVSFTTDTQNGNGNLIGIRRITATGTYTPTPGTKSVIVEAVGGGGAGGGAAATSASQFALGGGGGGAAYGIGKFTSGFSGVTVTIGAAGTGAAGASGGAGGTTSFGALLSCPGGNGGGSGAALSGGDSTLTVAGTGGAAASGGNILALSGIIGTPGLAIGSAIYGGGAGASGKFSGGTTYATFGASGIAGSGNGGGGSGAANSVSSAATAGGNGSQGLVIVWEYA